MEEKEKQKKPILEFFMKTLNGMAYGLFATLIVGTIFGTIGTLFGFGDNKFCNFMANIFSSQTGLAYLLQCLTGAGIGVGIALALGYDPLKTIVLAAVGELAAFTSLSTTNIINGSIWNSFPFGSFKIGDPLTIYIVCILVALAMKFVLRKKTPVDIIIVPLFGLAVGLIASLLVRYPLIYVTYGIQWIVNEATMIVPFVMGIVVSVLMGMALTAPISSAAIAALVFSGSGEGLLIASGAAIIGCSCQMVGFAIQSRKDNSIGMVISIGIGTSMLQFKNILKKPVIWLPTIIASAIIGPISTCWIHVLCSGSAAGMGTAGLVGQIGTIQTMLTSGSDTWRIIVGILLLQIVLPGVLVFFIDLLFRKFGWIKEGDLKV